MDNCPRDVRMYILSWLDTASVKRMLTMNRVWWLSARDELFLRSLCLKRKGINSERTLKEMLETSGALFRDLRLVRSAISSASWERVGSLVKLQALTIRRCASFPRTYGEVGALLQQWSKTLTRLRSISFAGDMHSQGWGLVSYISQYFPQLETLFVEDTVPYNAPTVAFTPMPNLRSFIMRNPGRNVMWTHSLTDWVAQCPRLTCLRCDLMIDKEVLPNFFHSLAPLSQLREVEMKIHVNSDWHPWAVANWEVCKDVCFPQMQLVSLHIGKWAASNIVIRQRFREDAIAKYVATMFPKLKSWREPACMYLLPVLFASGLESFTGGLVADLGAHVSLDSRTLKHLEWLCDGGGGGDDDGEGRDQEWVQRRKAVPRLWSNDWNAPLDWLSSIEIDTPNLEGRFCVPAVPKLHSVVLRMPKVEEVLFSNIGFMGELRLDGMHAIKSLQLVGLPLADAHFDALCRDVAAMPCLTRFAFGVETSWMSELLPWEAAACTPERLVRLFGSLPHCTDLLLCSRKLHRHLATALSQVIPPLVSRITFFARIGHGWGSNTLPWPDDAFLFLKHVAALERPIVIDLRCVDISNNSHETRVELTSLFTSKPERFLFNEFDVSDEEDDFWG